MFRARSIKHARLLIRHAEKLIRYRCDVLSETALADIRHRIEALERSIKERDLPEVRENSEHLDALVAEHSPSHREAGWRENCEVILVAIVVAVGVRSYFIQPFKIPTGSMQPTLNGIIGHPRTEPAPNILGQIAEFIILGRNYIDVVSRQDDQVLQIAQKKFFFFFTFSRLICQQQNFLVYAPPETLSHDFNVFPGRLYHRDEIIARGAVDTGDQVFVDKFSYNFVKPHRGDVFVFRTNHIFGIREDPDTGSPFYIKRLAGLPGDELRIDPPLLFINGKIAEGFGFARIMTAKPPYRGYALGHDYLSEPNRSYTVPKDGYFALGDNSYNSFDGRYWGPVPQQNLVGRGLLVYWPFYPHWGLIR